MSFLKNSFMRLHWLGVALGAAGTILAAEDSAKILNVQVISPDRSYYSAWGTVARAPDGTLATVYSGGREDHVDPFGRIEMITSHDDGQTWTWPRVLIDSATDDRDAALLITRKGTWLMGFYTSIAYQKHLANPAARIDKIFGKDAAAHIERAKLAQLRLTPEEERKDLGYWMMRSTDGGLTWSKRMRMPCYSIHGPTEMQDGRLFFAGSTGKTVGVWISDDQGASWKQVSTIDVRPGETHGIEAADGTWIVQVRDRVTIAPNTKPQWAIVQLESRDEGKTWTKPHVVAEGYPPHLLRLRDGRLLMSYGWRQPPYGIRAKVSHDNGQTWGNELVLTRDSLSTDLGYPSTAELADGKLLTVWYEVMAGSKNAVMRQAKWELQGDSSTAEVIAPPLVAVSRQSLATAPQAPSSGEKITVKINGLKYISPDKQYYHGWGTVAAGRDGMLHLVYSGGRDYHVCPLGRLEYMSSRDGGETWTWPRVLDDSLTDNRDSGIVETPNGVLLASFYTSIIGYQIHMKDPKRLIASVFGDQLQATLDKWALVEARSTQTEREADVGYWMKRSTDGGLTWSARYKVPGYNPHGPVALRDGRMFFAMTSGAWTSQDDGLTWQRLSPLPTGPGEKHSIEAADGALIVHVRNRIKQKNGKMVQRILQSRSEDGGRTWDAPQVVADGFPSHLVRLKDGTLITTYGWRKAPFGIRGKVSRDHGRSWSDEFILTKDGANWDLGYPSTVQLTDGTLLTVWYEAPADSHLAQLRQAKWELK